MAQAYLPPQDVTSGDIEVRLMPGLLDGGLEGIVVSGAQRVSEERIRAMVAAPMRAQQGRLNAQQLEEGLLRAAGASLLPATSNASALALFAWQDHVWWHLTLALAVANVAGSLLGTRMALRHGTGFVRVMFLIVVGALVIKTGHDAFLR